MANAGPLCKFPLEYVSTTNSWENLISVPISPNTTVRLTLNVAAQQSNLAERAAFSRSGVFYRSGGASQTPRIWHTIFTERSTPGFDVRYVLGATDVTLQIKAANNIQTFWTGSLEIEETP